MEKDLVKLNDQIDFILMLHAMYADGKRRTGKTIAIEGLVNIVVFNKANESDVYGFLLSEDLGLKGHAPKKGTKELSDYNFFITFDILYSMDKIKAELHHIEDLVTFAQIEVKYIPGSQHMLAQLIIPE